MFELYSNSTASETYFHGWNKSNLVCHWDCVLVQNDDMYTVQTTCNEYIHGKGTDRKKGYP